MSKLVNLNQIELDTVLTALRSYQAGHIVSLQCDVLTDDDIDALCESINCTPEVEL